MKKLKLIYFVVALFGLTLNSSVLARGDHHHHGHHRSHIGELVLGMAVGSVIRYGLGYEAHSSTIVMVKKHASTMVNLVDDA